MCEGGLQVGQPVTRRLDHSSCNKVRHRQTGAPQIYTPELNLSTKIFRRNALATRGWTLQERILAPRILHFGKSEIGWECASKRASECQSVSTQRTWILDSGYSWSTSCHDPLIGSTHQPAMLKIAGYGVTSSKSSPTETSQSPRISCPPCPV